MKDDLTVNCAEGRHARCRCEEPGQDSKWAGLIVEWDNTIGGLIPGAYCQCPCHGAMPARSTTVVLSEVE